MAEHREKGLATPWFRHTKTLVIGAGAMAAALVSIFALWDRAGSPPGEDVATITSVTITSRTSLLKFSAQGLGKELNFRPVPHAAQESRKDSELPVGMLVVATSTADPTRQTPPKRSTSTPPVTPTAKPTWTSTATHSASESSLPETATPAPSSSTTSTTRWTHGLPSEEYLDAVRRQQLLKDVRSDVLSMLPIVKPPEAVDEKGNAIPPDQVAAELKKALEAVETDGGPSQGDPLGWTVAVGLELKGLPSVPLFLTWSLDGLEVPETWRTENLAYRIVATTQDDTGVAEIWIPDLRKPGVYNVNVRLNYDSNGAIAAFNQLRIPNN